MTWHDPTVWQFALLAAFAYRLMRLVAVDVITMPLRVRLTRIVERDDERYTGGLAPRPELRAFITCPWCVGFWICLLVSLAWWAAPDITLAVAVPFAANLAVGLTARHLDT